MRRVRRGRRITIAEIHEFVKHLLVLVRMLNPKPFTVAILAQVRLQTSLRCLGVRV